MLRRWRTSELRLQRGEYRSFPVSSVGLTTWPQRSTTPREQVQAAIFMTDNTMFAHRKEVAELALTHKLPTIHSFPQEVQDGGLMFYGPSNDESYKRAAALTNRILNGARP